MIGGLLIHVIRARLELEKPTNLISSGPHWSSSRDTLDYKVVAEVVHKYGPEVLPHLNNIAGTGVGIEFRETGLNLNAKNGRVLHVGMSLLDSNIWNSIQ